MACAAGKGTGMDRKAMIEGLMPKAAGDPALMLRVAQLMRADGQEARAMAMAAGILDPGMAASPPVLAEARRFVARTVPHWHFGLVRDRARNRAYEAALRAMIRPGMRVLEIGTGTGLLAMMAARAGAAEVVTCESNAAVADAARHVIAANGFADRVRVVAKPSTALELGVDLDARADLLVSEIVSHDLLREQVLPAHEDAVARLLAPGASVIPGRGQVRVALAELPSPRFGAEPFEGFDLSAFDPLLPPERRLRSDDPDIALRSGGETLFAFDFATAVPVPGATAEVACTATGGRVTGILQWIALDLAPGLRHENAPAPDAPRSNWRLRFFEFPEPVDTRPGDHIVICGVHDRRRVDVWRA